MIVITILSSFIYYGNTKLGKTTFINIYKRHIILFLNKLNVYNIKTALHFSAIFRFERDITPLLLWVRLYRTNIAIVAHTLNKY